MTKFSFYSCVIFIFVFSSVSFADDKSKGKSKERRPTPTPPPPPPKNVTFENWVKCQTYNLTMAKSDFGDVDNFPEDKSNRMQIGVDSNKHLRVFYPEKAFGPDNSGNQFKVQLQKSDEYEAGYRLKFECNFDFDKGGKLPGLCGGDCNTEAKKSDDGFSVRFMWKQGGELAINLFAADQQGNDGQEITTNFKAPKNQWVTLKQRVKLNKGDKSNGVLQVWVNNELKIDRKDIRYIKNSSKKVDTFCFSTYFGGNDISTAPEVSSYARFDDFVIERK